VLEELASSATR